MPKTEPTHGGARKGAGRPPGEGWATRSTAFRPKLLERIDRAAEEAKLSRSAWLAQAAEAMLSK